MSQAPVEFDFDATLRAEAEMQAQKDEEWKKAESARVAGQEFSDAWNHFLSLWAGTEESLPGAAAALCDLMQKLSRIALVHELEDLTPGTPAKESARLIYRLAKDRRNVPDIVENFKRIHATRREPFQREFNNWLREGLVKEMTGIWTLTDEELRKRIVPEPIRVAETESDQRFEKLDAIKCEDAAAFTAWLGEALAWLKHRIQVLPGGSWASVDAKAQQIATRAWSMACDLDAPHQVTNLVKHSGPTEMINCGEAKSRLGILLEWSQSKNEDYLGSKPHLVEQSIKRGRKSGYDSMRDKEISAAWLRAKGAGVSKKEFARDENLSLTELNRILNRHAKRLRARK